jgi:superfamily I DNA/RNA helicase
VGDTHQSIYAFRGAVNAMEDIVAPTLILSQSWRYGERVAAVAECILHRDNACIRGNPSVDTEITSIESDEPHTEIFRTNAGLLSRAEELIDEGITVSIAIDVKNFARQVQSVIALRKGGKPFHDNIARFGSFEELEEATKEDPDLRRLLKTANRPDVLDFLDKLELNREVKSPTVILTTAHKSKGLEFDNVILADDFKFSIGKDLLDMHTQELNLLYVAATRARKKLMLPRLFKAYFETSS